MRTIKGLVVAVLVALAVPTTASAGSWLAGDLHVHSTYSHDSYGGPGDDNTGPEEAHTLGWGVNEQFLIAKSRGMHFLAITDHEDIRSQTDPGFAGLGVIGVPAYENSLRGHAQMLGARKLYDNGDESTAAVQSMANALRADGGLLQANHPTDPVWGYGYDLYLDAIEVWNLPRVYQPPLPSSSDNDGAIRFWESWLDRGFRVAATAGSDNHWRSTTAGQGAGQPTTWVYAETPDVRGVLDGIRRGRTTISYQPPAYGGPRVFIEADADRNGSFESMIGDTVPPGTPMRARVVGAPGAFFRVLTNGGQSAHVPVPVTSANWEHRFKLPAGSTWGRAEIYGQDLLDARSALCEGQLGEQTTYCRNRILALGMTSAIYVR